MIKKIIGASGRHVPDLRSVVDLLGLALAGDRFHTCPFCGARRTAQLYPDHVHCFHDDCRVHATALDLVAFHLELAEPDGDGRFPRHSALVKEAIYEWLDDNPVPAAAPPVSVDPSAVRAPYRSQLTRLWGVAPKVSSDPSVREWLRLRGLSAGHVVDLDLARALPDEADAVSWAEGWRAGHRLLLPVYGPGGGLEALRARWVLAAKPRAGKTMPPNGWGSGAMTGCVLANPVALELLRGERTVPITVVAVEGEPDFLTWAIKRPDVAVFGVWQGVWSADIAAKVPRGSTVVIRTHHDKAGESYAHAIASTLSHVIVLRSKPDPADATRDENDRLRAGALPADPDEDAETFAAPAAASASGLPMELTREGKPTRSRRNVITLLEHHPSFRETVWFNTFDVAYYRDERPLDDAALIQLTVELGDTLGGGGDLERRKVEEAVVYVGRQHPRHPVADWLRSLTWDGTERLPHLFERYFGAKRHPLLAPIARWWMLSAVARAFEPGCQADYVLVVVGPQGVGKSTGLRCLAGGPAWFSDTTVLIGSKDAMISLQGSWVLEFAELTSMKGASLEAVKAFLTSPVDKFRPPYGKTKEAFPRTTVFVATTNDSQFLSDPTGNRRYWPVEVGGIDLEALERDREQLWAEAVHRLAAGEQRWPTPAEEERMNRYRARFEAEDPWVAPIVEWLDENPDPFTLYELMVGALRLSETDADRFKNRVAGLLHRLGYDWDRKRVGGTRLRVWARVDTTD